MRRLALIGIMLLALCAHTASASVSSRTVALEPTEEYALNELYLRLDVRATGRAVLCADYATLATVRDKSVLLTWRPLGGLPRRAALSGADAELVRGIFQRVGVTTGSATLRSSVCGSGASTWALILARR